MVPPPEARLGGSDARHSAPARSTRTDSQGRARSEHDPSRGDPCANRDSGPYSSPWRSPRRERFRSSPHRPGRRTRATRVGVAGGEFPNTPGAQSGWKIDCTTNAGTKVDNIIVADAGNAYWHRGAARTVTVTPTAAPSANITFAASAITASDLRRPISGGCIAGGAFIKTIVSTTVATLSKANGATGCAAATATVEHTTSRVIQRRDVHGIAGGRDHVGERRLHRDRRRQERQWWPVQDRLAHQRGRSRQHDGNGQARRERSSRQRGLHRA